jgi:hypothetical protein
MKIGMGNPSTRRKPAPAPLCPPQTPFDQTRARTRAAAVGSQRLTAWAMARPLWELVKWQPWDWISVVRVQTREIFLTTIFTFAVDVTQLSVKRLGSSEQYWSISRVMWQCYETTSSSNRTISSLFNRDACAKGQFWATQSSGDSSRFSWLRRNKATYKLRNAQTADSKKNITAGIRWTKYFRVIFFQF